MLACRSRRRLRGRGRSLPRRALRPRVDPPCCLLLSLVTSWGLVVEGGEVGTDIGALGDAQVGVDVECLLPVVPGLLLIPEFPVGVADAVMGAGLFRALADLAGNAECLVVMTHGPGQLASRSGRFTQLVEHAHFEVAGTDVTGNREGLSWVRDGLVIAPQPPVDVAKVAQRKPLGGAHPDLTANGQRLLVMLDGLVIATQLLVDAAEVVQYPRLG